MKIKKYFSFIQNKIQSKWIKLKQKWKELENKQQSKLIFSGIMLFMLIGTIGISYAFFSVVEKESTFNIIVGDLKYQLSSDDLDSNRSIQVKAGKIAILDLGVASLNEMDTKYKIYYEGTTSEQVNVSYYKNDVYTGIGDLSKGERENIQVIIENNSSNDVTIQFGIQGEYFDKILTLKQGIELKELQENVTLVYNYNGNNPPNGFPKKDSGYIVTGVECKNAVGTWNNEKWGVVVTSITGTGAICTVNFEDFVQNAPELVQGMIPVTYDGSKWVKADTSSKWYDYDQQEWANAVTVTETTRAQYMSAPAGTEIRMDDINTMWVWIPRFEYQYTNLENQYAGGTKDQPGEIKVNFLNGTTNQPSDEENYKVHPAFTFGEKELTGIWYAKFEVTGTLTTPCKDTSCDTSQVTIKPGVTALREQTVSSFFYAARSMQLNDANIFGFSSSSGDVHMSKNSEWGAVAYLSQSKYGKYGNPNYQGVNKEIYQNKSSFYITGNSNGTPSTDTMDIQVPYDTPDTGYGASTTGTIYGVYDMSGGSSEYVMGNYNNTISSSGFSSMPESKYYDLYTTTSASTACESGICYGQSLSETSGWYGDFANFVRSNYPWMNRGGFYSYSAYAGAFFFNYYNGDTYSDYSSRFTIVP